MAAVVKSALQEGATDTPRGLRAKPGVRCVCWRGKEGSPSYLLLSLPSLLLPSPLKQSPPPTLPPSPSPPHFLPSRSPLPSLSSHLQPLSSPLSPSSFPPSTPSHSLRPISPTHPPPLPCLLPASSTLRVRHVSSSAHAASRGTPVTSPPAAPSFPRSPERTRRW